MAARVTIRRRRGVPGLSSYLNLLPFWFIYVTFVLVPILLTVALTFARWDGINEAEFVGTANLTRAWGDPMVWKSFRNLLYYVALAVPLGVTTGLVLALFVDRLSRRWSSVVRSAAFLPFIMPLFITAVIWRWMLAPEYGLVNQILAGVGLSSVDWLGDPVVMVPALVAIDLWHSAGFNMLLIWAGLRAVSPETREAARVDGASTLQEIRFVILPQVRLVVFVVAVNALISAFQVFDLPWLVTKSGYLEGAGGPNQTLLFPVMLAVTRGLGGLEFGQSATVGLLLLILIVGTTALMFRLRRRWEF